MKNPKIGASLLSLDFLRFNEKISELKKSGVDFFHIDIMDGNFVPNLSFSSKFVNSLKVIAPEIPLDIHFMVTERAFINLIDQFIKVKPEYVTVHKEAISKLKNVKDILKKENIKIGIALNPDVKIDSIKDDIGYIDLVLLMSVKAGFGGQKFLDSTFQKIDELLALNGNFLIEVDGGINLDISLELKKRGVDLIVIGTSLLNSRDPEYYLNRIKYQEI